MPGIPTTFSSSPLIIKQNSPHGGGSEPEEPEYEPLDEALECMLEEDGLDPDDPEEPESYDEEDTQGKAPLTS